MNAKYLLLPFAILTVMCQNTTLADELAKADSIYDSAAQKIVASRSSDTSIINLPTADDNSKTKAAADLLKLSPSERAKIRIDTNYIFLGEAKDPFVILSPELIEKLSIAGIAFVIEHELAHLNPKIVIHELIKSAFKKACPDWYTKNSLAIFSIKSSEVDKACPTVEPILQGLQYQSEFVADLAAIRKLNNLGIDFDPSELYKLSSEDDSSVILTHPTTKSRIEALQKEKRPIFVDH